MPAFACIFKELLTSRSFGGQGWNISLNDKLMSDFDLGEQQKLATPKSMTFS
jgi:hypothetical protein